MLETLRTCHASAKSDRMELMKARQTLEASFIKP